MKSQEGPLESLRFSSPRGFSERVRARGRDRMGGTKAIQTRVLDWLLPEALYVPDRVANSRES